VDSIEYKLLKEQELVVKKT